MAVRQRPQGTTWYTWHYSNQTVENRFLLNNFNKIAMFKTRWGDELSGAAIRLRTRNSEVCPGVESMVKSTVISYLVIKYKVTAFVCNAKFPLPAAQTCNLDIWWMRHAMCINRRGPTRTCRHLYLEIDVSRLLWLITTSCRPSQRAAWISH